MISQVAKKRVFVGLSGGVDSSVSAALLKKTGYDVTGVFIKVWQPVDEVSGELLFECTWKDDRLDAMRVCAKLNIPFFELNLEKEYKKEVVDYMIREYRSGRTPNPDVFCNRFIKFGAFYDWAMERGADFVATGHYARVASDATLETLNPKSEIRNKSQIRNPKLQTANYKLLTGLDSTKDQSYFLWQIHKEQLPHILFPVGGMVKQEVRKLAKKFGLITADKKDSQGLCFVGKVDMKEFLKRFIKERKGKVLSEKGEVIGEHDGIAFYTIGERMGVSARLNLKSGKRFNLKDSGPLYVAAKDIASNILTVSSKTSSGVLTHAQNEIVIKDCNWLLEPKSTKRYTARVRYRQPLQQCHISVPRGVRPPRRIARQARVRFASPQTVAPGQSLVVYDREILIGGGIVC